MTSYLKREIKKTNNVNLALFKYSIQMLRPQISNARAELENDKKQQVYPLVNLALCRPIPL